MQKQKRIIELLILTAEIYGKEVSVEVQKFWAKSLFKYELPAIEKAFANFIETEKFMPRPSQIIDRLNPNIEIKAIEAYQGVNDQMILTGSYRSIEFEDKAITRVLMSFGGWVEYCLLFREFSDRDLIFHEKEFIKRYTMYAKEDNSRVPARLIGRFEKDNSALGYDVPVQCNKIPLIGYEETKLIVAKGRKE